MIGVALAATGGMSIGAHAVVLGSSMAGLAAAKALSAHFARVTVIERDALPEKASLESRKGVPQGNHGHGLLASGYAVLDSWFPRMMAELVDEGAVPGDATADFHWYQFGAWKLRAPSGLRGIVSSRPLLEAKVRSRVRALPNVDILDEHDVIEPVFADGRVTGVRVRARATGAEVVLDADLIVDAMGRGSLTPAWLAEWGYDAPEESVVACNITYTTAIFSRGPRDFPGAMGGIIGATPPVEKRSGALFAIEGNRWLVTLLGALGEQPPTDIEGFREYARTLPTRDVFDIVANREPLTKIRSYRFAASRWRHYGKLSRFPEGYLVFGDAICSFNPAYGQGMSVALLEAQALDRCLAHGRRRLAARFFTDADALIATPWTIAVGEDMRYPEVEGKRPSGHALLTRYMDRVHRAATRDPVVLARLFEVASLLRSPAALLSPSIVFRVLVGGIGTVTEAPHHLLPSAIP